MTRSLIGLRMGRSECAIRTKAHNLKLPRRQMRRADERPQDKIEALTRLWNEGIATAEIGRRIGVTKYAVIGKARRLGLRPRPSPLLRPWGSGTTRKKPELAPPRRAQPGFGCGWPIGDPRDKDFRFCDAVKIPGKSYCADHHRLSVRKAGAA